MTDDEALVAGRGRSVFRRDDLSIGPTDAEGDRLNEDGATVDARNPELFELKRIRDARLNGQRPHIVHRKMIARRNHTGRVRIGREYCTLQL